MKTLSLVAATLAAVCATPPVLAASDSTTVVTGGDTTVVYVFPTSPQTFVPIAGLPSFLAMPGAPVPAVATEVVYTTPGPVAPVKAVATTSIAPTMPSAVDLDCSNFVGTVTISGPDRFHLDKDGDGIGCEPEDR
jgi:hypothetical protein